MRFGGLIILLFVSGILFGQGVDSNTLKRSVMDLNAALLNQDSSKLNQLLHKKCSYGHSNAWIENKSQVINDLFDGSLKYISIEQGPLTLTIEKETALVRSDIEVGAIRQGQTNNYKLHVLQVWVWGKKKGWQLLGRQGTIVK
jgi:Domain of unknown function (DUF4440)